MDVTRGLLTLTYARLWQGAKAEKNAEKGVTSKGSTSGTDFHLDHSADLHSNLSKDIINESGVQ